MDNKELIKHFFLGDPKDKKPELDWTDDEFYEGAWSWVEYYEGAQCWVDECELDEEDKDADS